MNEENRLLDVISQQSNEIDKLEKHINSLYVWIGIVAVASVITTLIIA